MQYTAGREYLPRFNDLLFYVFRAVLSVCFCTDPFVLVVSFTLPVCIYSLNISLIYISNEINNLRIIKFRHTFSQTYKVCQVKMCGA